MCLFTSRKLCQSFAAKEKEEEIEAMAPKHAATSDLLVSLVDSYTKLRFARTSKLHSQASTCATFYVTLDSS